MSSASRTVSVLITSYNQRAYLKEAIESVLDQTVQPYEIIIVDDYSQDGSQDLIDSYARKHPALIRTLYHERNQGVSAARNHGLAMVRGELFSTLDGDDRYLPRKIECELAVYDEHRNVPIVYSNYYLISEAGRRIWRSRIWPYQPEGNIFTAVFSRKYIMRDMLVRTNCLGRVRGFDEAYNLYEDWEWKIRLTKHYNVCYCSKALLEHRKNSTGLASQSIDKHIAALKLVMNKNAGLLDDLPRRQRQKILRSMTAILEEMQAISSLRQGHVSEFAHHVVRCLANDPLYIHTYKKIVLDIMRTILGGGNGEGTT